MVDWKYTDGKPGKAFYVTGICFKSIASFLAIANPSKCNKAALLSG
jgi:hypothetical protein